MAQIQNNIRSNNNTSKFEDGNLDEKNSYNNTLEDIDNDSFQDTMENVDDETNAQLSNIFGHQRIKSEFDLSSDSPTNALLRRTLMETDEMMNNNNNMDPLQNVAAMFSVGQGMMNNMAGNNVGLNNGRPDMNYPMRSNHLIRPNNPLGIRRRAPRGSRMGPQS